MENYLGSPISISKGGMGDGLVSHTNPGFRVSLRRSTLRSAAAGAAEFARSSKTRSLAAASSAKGSGVPICPFWAV